jgi:tRNA(fMet)-specific endonuclease VapC
MNYLLDTDTIIFMQRGFSAPARKKGLLEQAEKIARMCQEKHARGDVVGISAITVSELEFGARISDDYVRESASLRKLLAPFARFDYDSIGCASNYGEIRARLKILGVQIGALDTLIAAQAMSIPATLISNNQKHFGRIAGLKLENWCR